MSDYQANSAGIGWYRGVQSQLLASMYPQTGIYQQEPLMTGSKSLAVCNGQYEECDTLELAKSKAEQMAHKHQTDAYILVPKFKIALKRDVVTTEL